MRIYWVHGLLTVRLVARPNRPHYGFCPSVRPPVCHVQASNSKRKWRKKTDVGVNVPIFSWKGQRWRSPNVKDLSKVRHISRICLLTEGGSHAGDFAHYTLDVLQWASAPTMSQGVATSFLVIRKPNKWRRKCLLFPKMSHSVYNKICRSCDERYITACVVWLCSPARINDCGVRYLRNNQTRIGSTHIICYHIVARFTGQDFNP